MSPSVRPALMVLLCLMLAGAAVADGRVPSPSSRSAGGGGDRPPVQVPLERLLVALRPMGDATSSGGPDAADLPSRLRLSDPLAMVVVADPAIADRWDVPPFWFSLADVVPAQTDGHASATPRALEIGVLGPMGASGPLARVTVAATSTDARQVTVVEVLGGPGGLAVMRVGDLLVSPDELRVPSWRLPGLGVDAVALDGSWWSLIPGRAGRRAWMEDDPASGMERRVRQRLARSPVSSMRRLVDVSVGDVTADGRADVALAFRRPFRTTLLNDSRPRRAWVDSRGLSAHVGLYRPGDLSETWVAGTLLRPVAQLAACDGALAVAYSGLRRPAIVAASAWGWHDFGFLPLPELPGAGRPACLDIDRDGRLEAAIVERS